MKPVRWGILSTANIAQKLVLPGMRKSAQIELAAIASRNPEAARAVAEQFGIAAVHGSYEALLADVSIEAVYNPLPNHLHVPLTLAAAQASKHVLCEKPIALQAAELDALRPYAHKVHMREAFMVRHHPQWAFAREQIRSGAIGELRFMHAAFSYFNSDPANIRNQPGIGGGALYDIGCYAVVCARWFFEAEPERVIAAIDRDPALQTDRLTSGVLDFGSARHAAFTVSTQAVRQQRVQLVGTKGRVEIMVPFNPAADLECRVLIDDGRALDGSGVTAFTLPAVDQYQLQAESFSRAVREEAPSAAGLDDAACNMRIVDALFRSEASGRFEVVAAV